MHWELHLKGSADARERADGLRLARLRVLHIRDALIQRGIEPARIVAEQPDPNASAAQATAHVTLQFFVPETELEAKSVPFSFMSSELSKQGDGLLREVVAMIERSPFLRQCKFEVRGCGGAAEGADWSRLSIARADVVRAALIRMGLRSDRLLAIGGCGGRPSVSFRVAQE
jgi:outer membrane protein OmpA-like peptidoglycan-associated protein